MLTACGWLVALVLVDVRLDGRRPTAMVQGLFAWDAAFYRDIALHGYAAAGPEATRFHPLLPLLGRTEIGLLVVANVAALVAAALVHRLVSEVLHDGDLARRSATLVGIAPPAFCMVWAYSEALFLVLAALQLLALHRRRWWWAAVLGGLATLARPSGALLAVPVLITAVMDTRRPSRTDRLAQLAAVAAPGVAMVGWLLWVERRFGSATLPLEVQRDLRDGTRFPPFRLIEGLGEVVRDPFGDGLHIPFAVLIVALTWVAWQRLPRPWGWYALASSLMILSAGNLNSIERYALGTIPLVVAGGVVAGGRWWRPTVVISAGLLVGMSALSWYGRYVP